MNRPLPILSNFFWGIFISLGTGCNQNLPGILIKNERSHHSSCGFLQNVYGERVTWASSRIPVRFLIHDSVPSAFHEAIVNAAEKWNAAAGRLLLQVSLEPVTDHLKQPRQDGRNIIYWNTEWEANMASEQGRTTVFWSGNEIREADIRINAKNFEFYLDNPPNRLAIHFESLIVHEFGHSLGLTHQNQQGSIMSPYLSPVTERISLAQSDVESIRCGYFLR